MSAVRKTRTDAWEAKLSDEDRTKLYALCGHLSYNSAKLLAKSELKITLPGSSTFYRFLARMREAGYTPHPVHPILGQHLASETVSRTVYLYAVVWIPVLV